jgi:peroxiredoxin
VKRIRRGIGAGALLLAACVLAGCGKKPRSEAPEVGARVPAYAAASLAGDSVRLGDLRGQPVLLNVWATWCPPCREEMPALEQLSKDYAPRGLRVVGVSVDAASDDAAVQHFIKENGITFTILRDPDEAVVRLFRAPGVPATFLIGPDGVLRRQWIGRIDPGSASVRGAVDRVLAGQS